MISHPLIAYDLASIIHAERMAAAAAHRRSSGIRNVPSAPPRPGLRLASAEGVGDDLAHWLERSGRELAARTPEELDRTGHNAMCSLVAELLAVAREGGVDLGVTTDAEDAAVVLLRTHAALAVRTAGRSIAVSERRRRRLQTIMNTLVRGSDLAARQSAHIRAA